MQLIAIVCGALLIATGFAGYLLADVESRSLTAFIPAVVGVLLLIAGIWALLAPKAKKHAMHAAAVVGLLGAIMAGGRLGMVLATSGGSTLGNASLTAMLVICVVFLVFCIQSFRKARQDSAAE